MRQPATRITPTFGHCNQKKTGPWLGLVQSGPTVLFGPMDQTFKDYWRHLVSLEGIKEVLKFVWRMARFKNTLGDSIGDASHLELKEGWWVALTLLYDLPWKYGATTAKLVSSQQVYPWALFSPLTCISWGSALIYLNLKKMVKIKLRMLWYTIPIVRGTKLLQFTCTFK